MIIYFRTASIESVEDRLSKWDGTEPLTVIIDPPCQKTQEACVKALLPRGGEDIEPCRIIDRAGDFVKGFSAIERVLDRCTCGGFPYTFTWDGEFYKAECGSCKKYVTGNDKSQILMRWNQSIRRNHDNTNRPDIRS